MAQTASAIAEARKSQMDNELEKLKQVGLDIGNLAGELETRLVNVIRQEPEAVGPSSDKDGESLVPYATTIRDVRIHLEKSHANILHVLTKVEV